jgi:membrane-associated phospholipid phosphatase
MKDQIEKNHSIRFKSLLFNLFCQACAYASKIIEQHWQEDKYMITLTICYYSIACILGAIMHYQEGFNYGPVFLGCIAMSYYGLTMMLAMGFFYIIVTKINLKQSLSANLDLLCTELQKTYVNPQNIRSMLLLYLLIPWIAIAQSNLKSMIPMLNHHVWDATLLKVDQYLLFGHDIWPLLTTWLNHPKWIYFIDFIHTFGWITMMVFMLSAVNFDLNRQARQHFLLAFFLTWLILGGLLATIFASLGPCFYIHIHPHAAFNWANQQLATLHHQDALQSIISQQALWANHIQQSHQLGIAISAFPSLHVGSVAIYLYYLRSYHRGWLSHLMFGFLALIVCSTLQLGWHYLIDDIAAVIGAWMIWIGSQAMLKRYGSQATQIIK